MTLTRVPAHSPVTDESVQEIRKAHRSYLAGVGLLCVECSMPKGRPGNAAIVFWPCQTAMLLEYMDAAVTRATTAYRSPESSWEYDEPPVSAKAPESAPDEPSETLADDLVVSGVARPWTRENNRFFGPLKCKACGEDLQLHQPVVERPIMSVNFYHVMKEDCAALMEGVEVPE